MFSAPGEGGAETDVEPRANRDATTDKPLDAAAITDTSTLEGLLPASLDPGRAQDPHFQKANKAVLKFLADLQGELKVCWRSPA